MKFLKLTVFIFVFILITQSCNHKQVGNNDLIPQDTMAMLIADIHIADATLSVIMNTEKFKNIDEYYASVLKKYNIDRARFDTSLSIYSSNSDEFNKVYEDVMLILSQKEGEVLALPNDKKQEIKPQIAYRNVILTRSNFDEKDSKYFFLDKRSSKNSKSGKYSLFFGENEKISKKLSYKVENIRGVRLSLAFRFKLVSEENKRRPFVIIEVIENGNKVLFEKDDIYKYISIKDEWDKILINNSFKLKKLSKKAVINIYISNVFNQEFFIDDLYMKLDVN